MVTMNDDKIIKNIKERMAISNLEKEYSMNKKGSKKLLLSLLVVFVIAGSLATVDAVTDGSITNAVKDTIAGWTKVSEEQTEGGKLVTYEKTKADGENIYVVKGYNITEGDFNSLILEDDPNFIDKLNAVQ